MLKPSRWLILFAFSLAVGAALASRNTAGTYSLPNSPFISGTTISSSVMNGNFSDVSTELTNSLDRNGRGAMLAPLQLANGTSTSPSLTFASEQSTGLYRAALNDVRLQVNSSQTQRWQPTATTISTGLTVTANAAGAGVTATASGNFTGVVGTGGATGGFGVLGEAGTASGATGVHGDGDGAGTGVQGFGGATSGLGGEFEGGTPNGIGIQALGHGTAVGGIFAAGTTSTGASPTDAIKATNGNINLDGVANPNSNIALKNRITPKNITKAWASVTTSGSGTATVNDGFDITSNSVNSANVVVSFAQAMASGNCAALVTGNTSNATQYYATITTSGVTVWPFSPAGVAVNPATTVLTFSLSVLCAQ